MHDDNPTDGIRGPMAVGLLSRSSCVCPSTRAPSSHFSLPRSLWQVISICFPSAHETSVRVFVCFFSFFFIVCKRGREREGKSKQVAGWIFHSLHGNDCLSCEKKSSVFLLHKTTFASFCSFASAPRTPSQADTDPGWRERPGGRLILVLLQLLMSVCTLLLLPSCVLPLLWTRG